MNRFTIMPEFVNECKLSDYYFEVLAYFPMKTNPFKICMDNKGLAANEYEKLAKESELILRWISSLNDHANNIYKVNLEHSSYDSVIDLFLAISNHVLPSKQLITSDKAIFNEYTQFIQDNQIQLLDPDQAASILNSRVIQLSYGDNSPNIIGNNNKIR